jgi:DNA-3-methyladenine glycosylase
VTNKKDVPDAVLIRAIKPVVGLETMLSRSGKPFVDKAFGTGPGNVAKILGIHYTHSGMDLKIKPASLSASGIWIEEDGNSHPVENIITGPRIGVQYAGADALRPYRFRIIL